jgi:hypothetical protein
MRIGVIGALSGGPAVPAETDPMHSESATDLAVRVSVYPPSALSYCCFTLTSPKGVRNDQASEQGSRKQVTEV